MRTKVHHAIAHERIRCLFDARILRYVHRNLDSGIATLCRLGIRITGRTNRLDRIELLLGILIGLAQVRQQIRTRAIIIGIFAKRILERLADAQNAIGFNHCNTELVIPQSIATPEIRNAVFQGFAQVPVIHTPHDNAARREPGIIAIDIDNNSARLFGILCALILYANAIFKHQIQAIHRHSLYKSIRTFIGIAQRHADFAILVPTALTVFNQQVFACAQRNFHNLGATTGSRSSNVNSYRLPCHRAHFFHRSPPHIGAFPCRRHSRQETITRIVTCKVHHVVITQAANTLHHIVGIRESKFAGNLVHDNSIHAPVQAILRCGFTRDHNRFQRIDGGIFQEQGFGHQRILLAIRLLALLTERHILN